jgi:hypothetical protein
VFFLLGVLTILVAGIVYWVSFRKIERYLLPRIYRAHDNSHFESRDGMVSDINYVFLTVLWVAALSVHLAAFLFVSVILQKIGQEFLSLIWAMCVTSFFSCAVVYALLSARIKKIRFSQ